MDTMIQSLNWNNDLEIDEPRRRGLTRLKTGGLLFIIGVIFSLIGAPQVGGFAALIGVASLPCAALEMLTQQSWPEARPLTRYTFLFLGIIVGFPVLFAAILLPVAWLNQ